MVDQSDQLFFEENPEEEESSIDIKRYLTSIIKRKWLVFAITVIVAVPWVIYVKMQPPIYEAETIIRFKDYVGTNEGLLHSRMTELKSRRFGEKVVQQLGLCLEMKESEKSDTKKRNRHQIFQEFSTDEMPKFGDYSLKFSDQGQFFLKYYPADIKNGVLIDSGYVVDYVYTPYSVNGFTFTFIETVDSLPPEVSFHINRFRSAVDGLLARRQIYPSSGGTLLHLKMTGRDPVLVTRTVNRLAEIYRKESRNIKDDDTGSKLRVLQQQLALAKARLDQSTAALKKFQQGHYISLDTEVGSAQQEREMLLTKKEKFELERNQLDDLLNRLIVEFNTNGLEYNSNTKLLISTLAQLSTFDTNSEMTLLRTKIRDLENERNNRRITVTETHSSVLAIQQKIVTVYPRVQEAAQNHLRSLNSIIRTAGSRINKIDRRLNMLPQERQRQNTLSRAVERDQEGYDELNAQVQTVEMNKTVETENIEIFQKAYVPEFPINHDKPKKAAIGGILGLLLGIAAAIGLEILDKTIKSSDDIKKFLKMNLIGTIPEIEFKGTDEFRDEEKIKQIDNQLVTHDYSPTPIGEAYRSLRTNLLFSKRNGQIRNLVITSTAPGDGKSFTSSNIAISMAQQRSNTLLVDADLRRGVLHNTFGISKEPGFTNFLTSSHTFSQIINETYIPNLAVVSCGSLLPNPSELLGSLQMKRFLEQAQRRFEIVIFDSPPLNAATDAVVIGTQVDGVVVVVRVGVTNRDVAKAKLEMFRNVPAKILGVVLNGGDANLAHEAYSYYHY